MCSTGSCAGRAASGDGPRGVEHDRTAGGHQRQRKHENVVIDTSAYTSKRLPAELVAYMQSRGGRRKVLFGTNFPMIPHATALRDLAGLGLDDEARELYLDGNARRVFDLG